MSAADNAAQGIEITVASTDEAGFPCDNLRVTRLAGSVTMSKPYVLEVDVASLDRHGIDAAAVLGKEVSVVFTPYRPGKKPWEDVQRIHGMVARVEDKLDAHKNFRAYRLHIVPRLERLTFSSSQEIFLATSVPDILKAKLDSAALTVGGPETDAVLRLNGTYAPREFVLQYKETDLAFFSRLAEHLGIAFFFTHDGDFEHLVITDHLGGFAPGAVEIPYHQQAPDLLAIRELSADHRLVPKTWTIHDYNYRVPHLGLLATQEIEDGYGGDVVEYGAHVKGPDDAAALARIRAEEQFAQQVVYTGASNIPALRPGMRVTVTDHPDLDAVELLLIEVRHEATQGNGPSAPPGRYSNTFRAIPGNRMYRPPRVTPKPRIFGLVNGVVDPSTGGSGQYAELDDQGRYRVRFLFDTSGRSGQYSSHPMRMLQNHAGENYGTHFPLKPGVEVLVAFLDGDPDRPVIVGAVPNPITPSPVNAGNADIHRIKSINGTVVDFT
jgi:type VI secretion system secreted protein VgrG